MQIISHFPFNAVITLKKDEYKSIFTQDVVEQLEKNDWKFTVEEYLKKSKTLLIGSIGSSKICINKMHIESV